MDIKSLIISLHKKGILVSAESENLVFKGNISALDSEDKIAIKTNKSAILEFLAQSSDLQKDLIKKRNVEKEVPLSDSQKRLWFIDQLEGASAQYNMPLALELKGELDIGAFNKTWTEIVNRHEVLRTNFTVNYDGNPIQVIVPETNFSVALQDYGQFHITDAAISTLINNEASAPFNLEDESLIRISLYQLADKNHLLLITMHHIISDGWSSGVLVTEFSALYEAYRKNESSPLSPLSIQYGDYAAWQQERLHKERRKALRTYWKKTLDNAPDEHSLPLDNPRGETFDATGKQFSQSLGQERLNKLKVLAANHGATLTMLLHAILALLLCRWSRQQDILIAMPISGRLTKQLEPLIGFFVNTLVLRSKITGNTPFSELLQQSKEALTEGLKHQELPFHEVVDIQQPKRALNCPPLVQIAFGVDSKGASSLAMDGLQISGVEQETYLLKYDLEIMADDTGSDLIVNWGYAASLFTKTSVKRLADAYVYLIDSVLKAPSELVNDISIVGTDASLWLENKQLINRPYTSHLSIAELFADQVSQAGVKAAIKYGDETINYAELDKISNAIAQRLQSSGINQGDKVGIFLSRCPENIFAQLAILKLGAVYVPLAPEQPEDRLKLIIDDCDISLILTLSGLNDSLPDHCAGYLFIDEITSDSLDNVQPFELPILSQPISKTEAYVMYTSGSTGKPKGVIISQQNIVRLVCHTNYVQVTNEDVVAHMANTAFDASTFEIWSALLNGACIEIFDNDTILQTNQFAEVLKQHSISVLFITTALFNQIARQNPTSFSGLSALLFGGEAVDNRAVNLVINAGKPDKLLHVYGPTENSTFSTFHEISAPSNVDFPIGDSINGTACAVVDQANQILPPGAVGELLVSGDGVALGYLNRPDQQADKFIQDLQDASQICYRTGDLVKWNCDGQLVFIGRVDNQVKIRGFRIEPSEIALQIKSLAEVTDACVLVNSDDKGEKQLRAWVILNQINDANEQIEQVKRALAKRLPAYMLPSCILPVESWPLTPNGKIDSSALPQPTLRLGSEAKILRPKNDTQNYLATLWSELLERPVETISITANFFELGGHSLLVTRLVNKINSHFNANLSVKQVFENPTVMGIAELLEQSTQAHQINITKRSNDVKTPLSSTQRRLWFIDQLQQHQSVQYNMPIALYIEGELNIESFEKAIMQLIDRHEILRTTYHEDEDGKGYQVAHRKVDFTLLVNDLSHLSKSMQQTKLIQCANDEAQRPFKLTQDISIRAQLYRVATNNYALLLTIHHIGADGWSLEVLQRDLLTNYQNIVSGQTSTAPSLAVQYGDFASWEQERIAAGDIDQQVDFWLKHLADLPKHHQLPADFKRPLFQSSAGAIYEHQIDVNTVDRLQQFASENNLTMFMLLQSVFALLIGRLSHEQDVVIGTPVSGRESEQLHDLVGFFANTLVLRNDLSENYTVKQYLAKSRTSLIDCFNNQSVPFELLVDKLVSERESSYSPLFQILFSFGKTSNDEIGLSTLKITPLESKKTNAKFDLSLHIAEHDEGALLNWEYCTDLFSRDTIAKYARYFIKLLELVVSHSDENILSLPLLSTPEFISSDETYGGETSQVFNGCLHEIFERKVLQYPQGTALVFNDQKYTYQQLNLRANQLAHQLIERDVKLGDIVGLTTNRGPELIIGLLAILKSGAAYLPIDPSSPHERITYQLQDANVALIVSDGALKGLDTGQCEVINVANMHFENSPELNENPMPNGLTADGAAYVIYTSGTTGKPKGVVIEHRNVTALFNSTDSLFSFSEKDCWTLFHSFAFDFSVWEIWGAFLYGAKLLIVPFDVSRSSDDFCNMISEHKVTVLSQTPSAFYQLSESVLKQKPNLSLRYVIFGGEALTLERLVPWVDTYGDNVPALINMYGITETTVHVTFRRIRKQDLAAGSSLIGKPLPHLMGVICNQALQPQPAGSPGELYIGGSALARNYLNRKALTEQRFISNPFSTGGQRLYKTGDIVRLTDDGEMEYLGRADQQAQIRGFRVELGEIEQCLLQTNLVKEAAVLVKNNGQQLIAYIVPSSIEHSDLVRTLQNQLRAFLPVYMLPNSFVLLDELPLTDNGKLDKTTLLSFADSDVAKERFVAPETQTQASLCEVWEDTLGLDQIGINDNFFAIGGDSIRVIQIVKHARKIGINLEVKDIFEYQTIALLGNFYDSCHHSNTKLLATQTAVQRFSESYELSAYLGDTVEDAYPASSLQKLMLEKYGRQGYEVGIYQPQSLFEVKGHRLDIKKLELAFNRLFLRHPALRTRFQSHEQHGFIQLVYKTMQISIPVTDLSRFSNKKQKKKLAELIEDDANSPIKLNEQCMRCHVICFSQEHWGLLITTHHGIEDGWGFVQCLSELLSIYNENSVLPNVAQENAFKQRVALEWHEGKSTDAQAYWQRLLRDFVPMPELSAIAKIDKKLNTSIGVSINKGTIDALKQKAIHLELPVKVLFLYGYFQALTRAFNISHVTVDLVTSGRTAELEESLNAVGLFWNLLPITSEVTNSAHQDISALQKRLIKVDSNPLFPVAEIYRLLGQEPSFAAFNFIDFHHQELMDDSEEMDFSISHSSDRFHHAMKLAVAIDRSSDSASATFEYDRRYFSEKQSIKFIKLYGEALKDIAKLPDITDNLKASVDRA